MVDFVIVVNFKDDCFKDFIGKKVLILLINRVIFIIVDFYVDIEFGIGVLKIMLVYD